MSFPNAQKGISQIFIAEILSIVASVVSIVAAVVMIISLATDADVGILLSAMSLILVPVIAIVAFVLQMIGMNKAGKDEESFNIAFRLIIASLIFTVAGSIIGNATGYLLISSISQTLSSLFILIATIYVIQGIMVLAGRVGDYDLADFGKTILKIIITVAVLSIIANLISSIFIGQAGTIISGITYLVAGILQLVQYICYLVLLGKASNMLKTV